MWCVCVCVSVSVSVCVCVCVQVFEGYGQTECGAASNMTVLGEVSPGHVGPPLSCNYVKLVDVEDMNYYADNGTGEVSVENNYHFTGVYCINLT